MQANFVDKFNNVAQTHQANTINILKELQSEISKIWEKEYLCQLNSIIK